jgi:hypothetical protein
MRILAVMLGVVGVVLAAPAAALDLDDFFGTSVPGFGVPFRVAYARQEAAAAGTGLAWGGFLAKPSIEVASGYDSAPDGAAGSVLLQASPSLLVTDDVLGFGAYAASSATLYPQNRAQDVQGYALGAGEKAVLPGETITLAGADLAAQETGFALDNVAMTRPVGFSVMQWRVSDAITAGMLTVTPGVELSQVRFPDVASQNRTDARESLMVRDEDGGPLSLVVAVHATQSAYRVQNFNADTAAAEAGVDWAQNGLWNVQALAGVAARRARFGGNVTAPVLELAADWMPTGLDMVRFSAAREIDDPDQVSSAPYTLSSAKMSWQHEILRDLRLNGAVEVENAAFLHDPLRETLVTGDVQASWQVNPALALTASYHFNDRQANFLRAANEHVFVLGGTWTL